MSSAARVTCPKCQETVEPGHVRTWVRRDPFGKSGTWDQYHVSCYADVLRGADKSRIAALGDRLRCWRDDYERSADGTLVTIPVHQLVDLIGEKPDRK